MPKDKIFVFDFDSTLTSVEALEELAAISLAKQPDKNAVIKQIEDITNQGVNGEISFTESLARRVDLLKANRAHLPELVKRLAKKISPSIKRNKTFFANNANSIYVVSAGFKEFIDPIVGVYGIKPERVFANTFVYDKNGNITGFDKNNHLAKHNGKIDQMKALKLKGEVIAIGDGYSDFLMKQGGASRFIAFTENIERANAVSNADHVAPNFDEVLFSHGIKASVSYPKNRIEIVSLVGGDELKHPFAAEGFAYLQHNRMPAAVKLAKTGVLIVPNGFVLDKNLLQKLPRLMAIGIAGKDKTGIDTTYCANHGIAVFAAPVGLSAKLIDYINKGYTQGCATLPNLILAPQPKAHRLLHIHQNKPGMLAQINTLLWAKKINILAQYLKTKGHTGYLIIDIDKEYDESIIQDLKKIDNTVRFRVLY